MKKSTKYLKIFANLIYVIAVISIFIFIIPKVLGFFTPFVVGFILSLIANPVVRFLEKKIKIKRKYGSAIMIVMVIGTIVLICYGLTIALIGGLKDFVDYIPTLYNDAGIELTKAAQQLQDIINKLPLKNDIDLTSLGETLGSTVTGMLADLDTTSVSAVGDAAKSLPSILVGIIVGVLATYFFITDHDKLSQAVHKYFPALFSGNSLLVYRELIRVIWGYFKAQFKIMGVMYIVLAIGLTVIGVKYGWIWAAGIAFLDMLPVFGTGFILWPWTVIKLLSGNYAMAAGMLIIYAICQVTHQMIQPKLIGDSVDLNPFATLFFMFIGYKLKGMLGMILAIPIGMILIQLYTLGAFDTAIWCVKEIVKDFNEFRRIEK
ncbi:MAG: sporulation integral membrane protein YtvI [Lachnospiraceae bacterium]|nr:sporulation integral membrane protein YtvI [Lachnospiraceae bacterium]